MNVEVKKHGLKTLVVAMSEEKEYVTVRGP